MKTIATVYTCGKSLSITLSMRELSDEEIYSRDINDFAYCPTAVHLDFPDRIAKYATESGMTTDIANKMENELVRHIGYFNYEKILEKEEIEMTAHLAGEKTSILTINSPKGGLRYIPEKQSVDSSVYPLFVLESYFQFVYGNQYPKEIIHHIVMLYYKSCVYECEQNRCSPATIVYLSNGKTTISTTTPITMKINAPRNGLSGKQICEYESNTFSSETKVCLKSGKTTIGWAKRRGITSEFAKRVEDGFTIWMEIFEHIELFRKCGITIKIECKIEEPYWTGCCIIPFDGVCNGAGAEAFNSSKSFCFSQQISSHDFPWKRPWVIGWSHGHANSYQTLEDTISQIKECHNILVQNEENIKRETHLYVRERQWESIRKKLYRSGSGDDSKSEEVNQDSEDDEESY
jgi:hypothetical protein